METLRQYAVLDTPPEQALDDLVALAAAICEAPIALISIVDSDRQWFKAKLGIETREMPRTVSFCAHALEQQDLFIVPDATKDERFADNPIVTGAPGIRFYAGAPLATREGPVLGTLCVIDRMPRSLTSAQKQALRVLSRQVMTQFDLRRRGQELLASEAKRRAIFEAEPECVKLLSPDGTLHEINSAGLRLIEADHASMVTGQNIVPVVVSEDRPAVIAMLEAVAAGERRSVQYRIVGFKGTQRWIEMNGAPFHDETTGQRYVLGVSHDITERKVAEEKIQRLNRLYAVSSGIAEAIVRLKDTSALYEQACRIAVEKGGLVMAWVGVAVAERNILEPVARWGRDEGYLDLIQVSTSADEPRGRGPAGQAFRSGQPACCNDIDADTGAVVSRTEALERGYRSCAAFPLTFESRPIAALVVYGDQPGYFDREEMHVLNALAENISFAIESNQREQQRLLAESALRASEGRYRTLFERVPDGIFIADAQGNYVDANPSAIRMLGYERDELARMNAANVVAENEVPRVAEALVEIHAGRMHHREWRFRHKDGSHFMAEVIATGMPDGNFLAMLRDITERKRAEARFRRLVDSNAQGVMFWTMKGEITGANDSFLRLIGYSREDLEKGLLSWEKISPPEWADRDLQTFDTIRQTGVCVPYEREFSRKDGSRVPVLVAAATFEDNPEEGFTFAVDLTDRKKLEQQFLRAQRMESIGVLAGGIAHDLNNVLSPIMMSLAVLEMKHTDKDSQELLNMLSTSAQRGADMVRQVLSFARGVEGRRMDVQLKHLVRELVKIANDTFPKNIEVEADLPAELDTVLGDPTQLHQVLLNLCVNARDAMPEGGRLALTLEEVLLDAHYAALNPEAQPGPYLRLDVADTGGGIPPEVIDQIFDPFFTTKAPGKGTGLGLSTTLGIVKSHGGFIRAYSEVGQGTKFSVYLPAIPAGSAAAPPAATSARLPRGHGELILVVDDEEFVRHITKQTLETFGYRVALAGDGAEALAVHAKHGGEIAAVLLDMMMPVLDGPATIRVLQRLNPNIRIIGASGFSTHGATAHAASLGVTHFLPKPYTAQALLKMLREILPQEPGTK